jgi:hypothetical protein
MRRSKLLLVLVAVVLAAPALVAPPPARAYDCVCDILCWNNGAQVCIQDECCRLTCCDVSDPTCPSFC